MSKDNIQIKESKAQGIVLNGVTEVCLSFEIISSISSKSAVMIIVYIICLDKLLIYAVNYSIGSNTPSSLGAFTCAHTRALLMLVLFHMSIIDISLWCRIFSIGESKLNHPGHVSEFEIFAC